MPLNIAMAFIKKLARLSLFAPPSGCIFVLPLLFNMLMIHDGSLVLIHRVDSRSSFGSDPYALAQSNSVGGGLLNLSSQGEESKEGDGVREALGKDPFDIDEKDPAKSRAELSSLWEIEALRSHYSPEVARLTKIFEQKLRIGKRYRMEDFVSHSFASIFKAEMKKSAKKQAALNPDMESEEKRTRLISESETEFSSVFSFQTK